MNYVPRTFLVQTGTFLEFDLCKGKLDRRIRHLKKVFQNAIIEDMTCLKKDYHTVLSIIISNIMK